MRWPRGCREAIRGEVQAMTALLTQMEGPGGAGLQPPFNLLSGSGG